MTPTPDPARRIRQHPHYPDVWEYPVEHIRDMLLTKGVPCRGCPNHWVDSYENRQCLLKGNDRLTLEEHCRQDTVWYGAPSVRQC